MSGSLLLLVFLASIALLFVLIIAFKWQPFLALIVATLAVGLATMLPFDEVISTMTGGFGTSLAGVGILIGLGVMFGQLLGSAGAIQKIAQAMLKVTGVKGAPAAVAVTGSLVSIPVFFDAAFIILVNLIRNVSRSAKISMMTLTTALAVGLITTHGLVPPTPGPIIVAYNVNVPLGVFLGYAIIVAIPAVIVAAIFYAKWIGRGQAVYGEGSEEEVVAGGDSVASRGSQQVATKPEISTTRSFVLLLLPIVIILIGSLMTMLPFDNGVTRFLAFLGDPNIGLLIGVVVTWIAVRPYLTEDPNELFTQAIADGGLVILISGAGGGYGAMLNASGVGEYLVELMKGWNMPIILLAFLFAQILRAALGNTTLALITASTVLGPLASGLDVSPLLLGLAICAGGIGLSLPNDSGFWVVNRFSGLTVPETLKTWTAGGTLAGLTALAMIFVLSLFSGVLPGM